MIVFSILLALLVGVSCFKFGQYNILCKLHDVFTDHLKLHKENKNILLGMETAINLVKRELENLW